MNKDEIEMLKMYLEEIKKIASTGRIGKVLVSPKRALEEVAFNAGEALKILDDE